MKEEFIAQIARITFRDLYLSQAWCDLRLIDTQKRQPISIDDERWEALQSLYQLCRSEHAKHGPEFSLELKEQAFRVTALESVQNSPPTYVLRRRETKVRSLDSLAIPRPVKDHIVNARSGLILVAGSSGHGKTSTLVSLIHARLALHSDIALAVEDPTETLLDGLHENGRCIQLSTSRELGYQEPLLRAVRAGIEQIMVGEIRDSETAKQVVEASINGHLILSTIHAGSIADTVDRLAMLYSNDRAYRLISEGINVLLHQRMTVNGRGVPRVQFETLVVDGDHKVRDLIQRERTGELSAEVDRQALEYRLATTANGSAIGNTI